MGVLGRYVDIYVKCRQCSSHDTHLHQSKLECRSCGAVSFAEVAEQLINIPPVNDPSCRYKMPALRIQARGCGKMKRTLILNLDEVSTALSAAGGSRGSAGSNQFACTSESILRFLSLALGSDRDQNSNSLSGDPSAALLQEKLRDYIDDF